MIVTDLSCDHEPSKVLLDCTIIFKAVFYSIVISIEFTPINEL